MVWNKNCGGGRQEGRRTGRRGTEPAVTQALLQETVLGHQDDRELFGQPSTKPDAMRDEETGLKC